MADSPAAEHSLDETGIRTLLRASAPQFADLPLRLETEGWDNAIWRLGDALAVRVPRRALAAPLIAHEQRVLPEIGARLAEIGMLTPVPVFAGTPSADFPWNWSIVPWIDGAPVLGSDRVENAVWSPTLANALRVLHVPAPPDAPHNPVRGNPLSTRDAVMRDRLASFPADSALRAAWAAGLAAPPAQERVWVHGDLHPGNMLTRDGDLVALIDFGDVTAGDPAYDLAVSWLLFDQAGRCAFRAATAGRYDEHTWCRARAWAAYVASVLLTQSDDRPEFHALGVDSAAELALDV